MLCSSIGYIKVYPQRSIMKVQHIRPVYFGSELKNNKSEQHKNKGFLETFQDNVKNTADMTDTIVVPRTIFKGYLGIMTGTTLVTAANLLNKAKWPKLFKTTMAAGLLASIYGTYAFVRPYIIKDAKGVATTKTDN